MAQEPMELPDDEPMDLPQDERRWYRRPGWRAMVAGVGIVAAAAAIYATSGGKRRDRDEGPGGSGGGLQVGGSEPIIFAGYGDNPIEADARYKGRWVKSLKVSVDHISRDRRGRAYVAPASVLVVGGSRPLGRSAPFPDLRQPEPCHFYYLRSDADAAGLKIGDTCNVAGRCLGYRKDGIDRGVSGMDWRVEFEDCTLEPVPPEPRPKEKGKRTR